MRWSEREGCVCGVVVCFGRLIKGGPGPKGGSNGSNRSIMYV